MEGRYNIFGYNDGKRRLRVKPSRAFVGQTQAVSPISVERAFSMVLWRRNILAQSLVSDLGLGGQPLNRPSKLIVSFATHARFAYNV